VNKYSTEGAPFTANEVFLSFGASGAIYFALGSLLEKGDNVIMP